MQIEVTHRSTHTLWKDHNPWVKVIYFSAADGGDICHTTRECPDRKGKQYAAKGEVGYLKVGYTDFELARKEFKTPYHFGSLVNGYCCSAEDLADNLHLYGTTVEKLKRDMARYLRSSKDFYFVDYIDVAPEFRRQGIGEKLYTTAAKWLAKHEGQALYSSSIQSGPAKAAWDAMFVRGDLPIYKSRRNHLGSATRFCMDFRND